MAILRPKEVRNLSQDERKKQLQQLKTELAREKSAVASGTRPENPGRIKEIRRTIARILTIEKEPKKAPAKKPVEAETKPKKETKKKKEDGG